MISPIHQDPADLALNVVVGRLHAPLTILKQTALHIDVWTFTFHIIGESHLVTIEREGVPVLCELLACAEVNAASRVHHHRFGDLSTHRFEQDGYRISVTFDDCSNPTLDDGDGSLEIAFPEIAGQIPLTRVVWSKVSENVVHWQTLHVYPHEGKVICVRSLSNFDTMNYNP